MLIKLINGLIHELWWKINVKFIEEYIISYQFE